MRSGNRSSTSKSDNGGGFSRTCTGTTRRAVRQLKFRQKQLKRQTLQELSERMGCPTVPSWQGQGCRCPGSHI